MNVLRWGRRLTARAACLMMVGGACLPFTGCGRKTTPGESELPADAKAKAAQMREEGMKAAGQKGKGMGKGKDMRMRKGMGQRPGR